MTTSSATRREAVDPGRSEDDETVITVGVLSDTHGHLYPQVKQLLAGVDHIIHAGDVGSAQVLAELRELAPVTAVRGNCDLDAWARTLPLKAVLELKGARILVGHMAGRLLEQAEAAGKDRGEGFTVVVTGHSHLAAMERRDGVLRLNPGSAGPRRYGRPRTIARLTVRPASFGGDGGRAWLGAEIVTVAGE
jgi:putative phosphoesterase